MKEIRRIKRIVRRHQRRKAVRVNIRWGMRRIRRFFSGEGLRRKIGGAYARRLYCAIGLMLGIAALTIASAMLCNSWLADEAVLVRRLSDPDFDRKQPVPAALACFGASNRIQVSLQTDRKDNLHPMEVDLDRGNINLVMTLKDGRMMEYTLQNRRIDNFESGSLDQFTLILPNEISVFDITEYKLVLLPDAEGNYGVWRCKWAQISFLLGGKRMLLAQDDWSDPFNFTAEQREFSLPITATENAEYLQVSSLYPYALAVCSEGRETVHDKELKRNALRALGMSEGDTVYLEIETVGLENQNDVILDLQDLAVPHEELNYNGKMFLRMRFFSDAAGAFYKDYELDTPGKDDFELGNSSSFALELPAGLTAFDIASMELMVEDSADAWAPRMIRAYLRTDYGTYLELARQTDRGLIAARGTNIFAKGLIETELSPLALDMKQTFSLPAALKEQIEKKFATKIEGVTYSMYFSDFDFYQRQKLFYSQIKALYGGASDEEA